MSAPVRLHEPVCFDNMPLRKCRYCGLEAWTEADLDLFRKRDRGKHGRDNWCKECFNKSHRSGGRYYRKSQTYKKNWIKTNEGRRINNARQYTKYHVSLENEVCEKCGSTENLHRHHLDYDDPLKIRILCYRCHREEHR